MSARVTTSRVTPDELAFLRAWQERGQACERGLVIAKEYLEAIRDLGHPREADMARKGLAHINREAK